MLNQVNFSILLHVQSVYVCNLFLIIQIFMSISPCIKVLEIIYIFLIIKLEKTTQFMIELFPKALFVC